MVNVLSWWSNLLYVSQSIAFHFTVLVCPWGRSAEPQNLNELAQAASAISIPHFLCVGNFIFD